MNAGRTAQGALEAQTLSNIESSNRDCRNAAFELASNLFPLKQFSYCIENFTSVFKNNKMMNNGFFSQRQDKQRILSVFVAWCHTHLIGLSLKRNQRFQQLSIILETFLKWVKTMRTKKTRDDTDPSVLPHSRRTRHLSSCPRQQPTAQVLRARNFHGPKRKKARAVGTSHSPVTVSVWSSAVSNYSWEFILKKFKVQPNAQNFRKNNITSFACTLTT